MSQSSELEEGEHPKIEDLIPVVSAVVSAVVSPEVSPKKESEEDNNHIHKLYTRGVAALLGGILDPDGEHKTLQQPYNPAGDLKIPLPELKQSIQPRKSKIVMQTDHAPRVVSIEKQLEEIRARHPVTKNEHESIEDNSDDGMEIEEENVIEVNKSLAMAAVRSVKSLDCPVCDERFQHPRMLTCLHTFCSSCIQKRIDEENCVSCPICLRHVKLSLPTVDLLPLNQILDKFVKLVEAGEGTEKEVKNCSTCDEPSLFWCVECQTDFCTKCKKVHLNIKAVNNHNLLTRDEVQQNVAIVFSKIENCKEHSDNELNLYCGTCDGLICRDCTLIEHKTHSYGFLQDCVAAKRRKLQEEVERGRTKLSPLKTLITAVEEDIKETENDVIVREQIRSTAEAVISHVRGLEKELLEDLATQAAKRSDKLRGKYKELQYAVNASQCSLDFLSAIFRQGDMKDLVCLAPAVRTRVAEITAYRPEVELNRTIRKFRSFPLNKLPSIGNVFQTLIYDTVGDHPHLIGGEGSGPGDLKFPTGLAFHPSGYIVVVDRANTLQVFEKTGSFLKEITNANIDGIGKLKNPNGVAVDAHGYFYVADSSKHRIAVFDPKGRFSHEIGARGRSVAKSPVKMTPAVDRLTMNSSNETSPASPLPRKRDDYDNWSRAYRVSPYSDPHYGSRDLYKYSSRDRERDYYHRESSSSRRRDYDRRAEPERKLSHEGHEYWKRRDHYDDPNANKIKLSSIDMELNGPRGVDIGSNGSVVVADTTNHCVKVYTRDGNYIRTIGEEGAKAGQLRTPSGVSMDTSDNVYVTDTELHRITVYKITGEYVNSFGKKGSGNGEFLFPSDVAVDKCNNVFVSDCDNNRIQVFDKEGVYIRSVNLDKAGTSMKKPLAVAVDTDGNVAVCDTGNHKVWLL